MALSSCVPTLTVERCIEYGSMIVCVYFGRWRGADIGQDSILSFCLTKMDSKGYGICLYHYVCLHLHVTWVLDMSLYLCMPTLAGGEGGWILVRVLYLCVCLDWRVEGYVIWLYLCLCLDWLVGGGGGGGWGE